VINRTGTPQPRTAWMTWVSQQYNDTASVEITLNRNYNIATRELSVTINSRALGNLTGSYFISYVLTEDSIMYTQNGNGQCPGASVYRLDHIARNMINGASGELLTNSPWNFDQVITRNLNYTVPNQYNPYNCYLNVFIYKDMGGGMNMNVMQQAGRVRVSTVPVGIVKNSEIAESYTLFQNYPNPFNPSTNIRFGIKEDSFVKLTIYNSLGETADIIVNSELSRGTYEVSWNSENHSSGVYYYVINAGNYTAARKMILLK
jgi:hypothetical protein